jgi:putative MFS transporter
MASQSVGVMTGFSETDLGTLKRLERLPFGRAHIKLLLMGGLGYTFDGMDAALIAFILPPVIKLWSLTNAQTGVVGSSLMVGYLVGAFLAGTLGDLIGRRKVMMYALFVYTTFTLVAALSPNWQFLFWSRVVAGAGIGAESAIIAPFLSEFVQSRFRGRFVGSLAGFFSFGFVFAALLGYFVVPAHTEGWRIAQIITFLPIVMLLWWRRSLPESPRFLMQRGRSAEARAVVERMEASFTSRGIDLPPYENVQIPALGARKAGTFLQNLASLWGSQVVRTTLMLWVLWLAITFSYYGFFTWIPTLLVKQGMTITKSFGYSLIIYLAQIPGYYSAAFVCEKLDRKWTIVGYLLLGGVSAYFLSGSHTNWVITWWGFWLSFFMNGTYSGMYVYTPELYPTAFRSTGMGVASSVGRIGGLLAPLIIGFTYANIGFAGVFTITYIVLVVGALGVAILGASTAGKSLEQIASSTAGAGGR